jgi:hypothetical protein
MGRNQRVNGIGYPYLVPNGTTDMWYLMAPTDTCKNLVRDGIWVKRWIWEAIPSRMGRNQCVNGIGYPYLVPNGTTDMWYLMAPTDTCKNLDRDGIWVKRWIWEYILSRMGRNQHVIGITYLFVVPNGTYRHV